MPSDTTSPPSAPSGDEKRLSFVIADDEPFGPHTPFQHIAAGKRANKPVVLEEYGLKIGGYRINSALERDRWLRRWRELIQQMDGGGTLVWMLGYDSPDTSAYRDPYTIMT